MAHMRVRLLGRAGLSSTSGIAPSVSEPKPGPIGFRPGHLIPSLATLIPKLAHHNGLQASDRPWVKAAGSFVQTWQKLEPCMPKYEAFLAVHKDPSRIGKGFMRDLSATRQAQAGKCMSEQAQAALGEFYLAVALQLRTQEIARAGQDSATLLQVARRCAEEDFEPFIEQARHLVADYDKALHQALEETCPLYEVDDGLFWRANFDVAAPVEFNHFLTALGHGSGQRWVDETAYASPQSTDQRVERAWQGLIGGNVMFEPARRAASFTYDKWLDASSMPVKATISKLLMRHGFLVSTDVHDSETLLPEVPALWPAPFQS